MASGEMTEGDFTAFLATVSAALAALASTARSTSSAWTGATCGELFAPAKAAYGELKNSVSGPRQRRHGLALPLAARARLRLQERRGAHINNVELGRRALPHQCVGLPGVSPFPATRQGDLLAMHPTVKAVPLVADAILDCPSRGDLVLDASRRRRDADRRGAHGRRHATGWSSTRFTSMSRFGAGRPMRGRSRDARRAGEASPRSPQSAEARHDQRRL